MFAAWTALRAFTSAHCSGVSTIDGPKIWPSSGCIPEHVFAYSCSRGSPYGLQL